MSHPCSILIIHFTFKNHLICPIYYIQQRIMKMSQRIMDALDELHLDIQDPAWSRVILENPWISSLGSVFPRSKSWSLDKAKSTDLLPPGFAGTCVHPLLLGLYLRVVHRAMHRWKKVTVKPTRPSNQIRGRLSRVQIQTVSYFWTRTVTD